MANTFLFGQERSPRGMNLRDTTIRDFSGGWNVVDNDLNLTTAYAKILRNMQRSVDGANQVRFGCRLFADCSAYCNKIVNITYYNNSLIAVGDLGNVLRISSDGTITEIFNDDFASKLAGNPVGWSYTTFASFTTFRGELIICNGVNKPLIINQSFFVSYLRDLATNTNANTPVCKYVLTHGRYLVMAGDPDAPSTVYISALDTSGTFVNDPDPNDAVNVNLGSLVPSGSQVIKGLGRFRDKIVVAFDEALLPGTLGVYTDSLHNPTFDDAIENNGCLSHRAIQTIGEDMFFCDSVGVNTVSRALFTGNVKAERKSELVDPEIQKDVERLFSTVTQEEDIFSLYDSKSNAYMLFIPNANDPRQQTQRRVFVYRRIQKLKVESWYEYTNWNFQCGCRSALKRVFLCEAAQVFIHGNDQDPIERDYVGDQEMFDDDTCFTDYTGVYPVADVADSGIPIPWVWELPWSDNGERFKTKSSRFLALDTQGSSRFTVKMFVDNIYNDVSDLGESFLDGTMCDDGYGMENETLDPALSMEFVGGNYPGFGADAFGKYYGGGRSTQEERLYKWPCKYKLQKFRFEGDSIEDLKIVSLTMAYLVGSIRR